jgi:hypothetical protein
MQFNPVAAASGGMAHASADVHASQSFNPRTSISIAPAHPAGTALSRARVASEYAAIRYPVWPTRYAR